ncbi:hypothetical protein OROHE_009133 [Orobanche hederae]
MALSGTLSEDAVVDILVRLPVKVLVRFKCVSPSWQSLISSPSFVSLHRKRWISDPSRQLVLVRLGYYGKRVPIQPDPINSVVYWAHGSMKLVGSVHGLVCVVGFETDEFDAIWVWNPSTRMSKKLPVGKLTTSERVTFGFGWDGGAEVYKLVKIVSDESDTKVEVWSSSSDSWKEIKVVRKFYHPHCMARITYPDATVKGGSVCYWIVMAEVGSGLGFRIVSFNMSTESLQIISMPKLPVAYNRLFQDLEDKNECVFGINWKEDFALVERYSVGSSVGRGFALWTRDAGERTWSKKLTFSINARFSFVLSSFDEKILLKAPKNLMSYDMRTGRVENIGDARVEGLIVGEANFFFESLVALEGFSKEDEEIRSVGDDINSLQEEENAVEAPDDGERKVSFGHMVTAYYNMMKEKSLEAGHAS